MKKETCSQPLSILIDPGTASPEEVAEVLSEISKLHRMMGGSGIKWEYKIKGNPEYGWSDDE